MTITITLTLPQYNLICAAILSTVQVIECTYGHDEETGERDEDAEPDCSGADIVDNLLEIERDMRGALDLLLTLSAERFGPKHRGQT